MTHSFNGHLIPSISPWGGPAAVRELASAVRPVLSRFDRVDPVPVPWLHLTMNGLGFSDEVAGARLEAISDEVFTFWASLKDPVERVVFSDTGRFCSPLIR